MRTHISRAIMAFILLFGAPLTPVFAATTYVGGWMNTTFGSSGAATIVIDISGTSLTVTVDLDGPVFGGTDPTPLVLSGTFDPVTGGTMSFMDHPTYGDVSATMSPAGFVSGSALDVPDPFIDHATFMGPVGPTGLIIDYVVFFTGPIFPGGPSAATGFISATAVPIPAALPLLGSALLLGMGVLRRRVRRR